ncbi:fadD [Bugula neritina]|uniref:FadD n=1 Tax=Bugula neritina TaxID=10212 RepID=A0A7J7KAL8_BUGNE|nr:fadD [Bugula neritina]
MSLTGSDSGGTKKELTESYYLDTSHPLTSRKLDEFLEEACLKNDDRYMTWVNPYEKMSHKEFYTKAMVLAKGLLAIGMKRGDTFCSFGSQGSDPVLLLIACASLGIKYTANYLYAPIGNVIRMMITRIKPNAVLVGNCTSGKRQELACAEFIKVIEDISKTHPHGIEHIIYDRKAANDPLCNIQDGWSSLASIYELGEKISDEVLREAKEKVVQQSQSYIYVHHPTNTAIQNGSTGEPKIVLLNARNMANAAFHGQQRNSNYGAVTFGVNDIMEGDVKLILVTFSCLATGNNAVIYPATNTPDDLAAITEILAATEKYKIQLMIHRADYVVKIANNLSYKDQYDLKSLSALVIGGYLSSPELKQKLAAFAPYSMDGYGGTEFLNSIDPAPISLLPPEKINTVGKPATNVEMKIVNEMVRLCQ